MLYECEVFFYNFRVNYRGNLNDKKSPDHLSFVNSLENRKTI